MQIFHLVVALTILVEILGGQDIDPNDNGIIEDDEAIDLKGSVYALAKGDELQDGNVRINALTDMAYQKLKGLLGSLSSSQIDAELTKSANEYLYDVNSDGEVNQKDILAFDPTKHQDKTRKSYRDILRIYVSGLHEGADETSKLASLMYLDEPRIVVENGLLQEVPFTLKTAVENAPKDVTIKWYINSTEKTSINEAISEDGIVALRAEFYKSNKLVKTVTSQVIATKKVEIASIDVDITKDNIIFVSNDINSSLSGTVVIIPQGALNKDVKIVVKKSSINSVPSTNAIGISDVLVLEPSGLTFNKPIQIRLPYNEDVNLTGKTVRIARYSKGGEIDYLMPLFVDEVNHEILFETEHFTEFKLETSYRFTRDIENQTEIQDIIKITGINNYSKEEWKKVLNHKIIDDTVEFRIYDLYLENKINKDVDEKLKQGTRINTKHTGEAFNLLYKDESASIDAQSKWNDVKKGLELINSFNRVGGAISKVKFVKAGFNTIDAVLGTNIPTNSMEVASWLNPYNPISLGDSLVKSLTDTVVGEQINRYFSFRDNGYSHSECFNNSWQLEATETNENGWYINSLSYGGGDLIKKKSVDFWKNIEKMYERNKIYKSNLFTSEFTKVIKDTKKLIDNNGDSIKVSSCSLKAKENQLMLGEKIIFDYTCDIESSSDNIKIDMVLKKYRDTYGRNTITNKTVKKIAYNHYEITIASTDIYEADYFVEAYLKLTENENIWQYNESYNARVNVIENKPTVTIAEAYISNYYFDADDNFIAEVSADLLGNEDFDFTIATGYDQSYRINNIISMTKDDYENLSDYYLTNFVVDILPTSEMQDKYYIRHKMVSFNIKEKIEDLKNNQVPTLTYSWKTSDYSTCSGACGTDNATQTRTATCKASDGTTAQDSKCTQTKPTLTKSCTASECPVDEPTYPSITLSSVESKFEDEEFTFAANLSKALDSEYSVKISLGDGGGGYLNPIEMTVNSSKDIFTFKRSIGKEGNRVYRVALYNADTKVSSFTDGSYVVKKLPAESTFKFTQRSDGLKIEWDIDESVTQYQLYTTKDGTQNGKLVSVGGSPTGEANVISKSYFKDQKVWYFGLEADGTMLYKGIKFEWIDTNQAPVATPQTITVQEDSKNNSITLSATDADNDTLAYTIVSNPSDGSLSGTAPNLTYTPTTSYSGSDSFTFEVNDDTVDSVMATVSIIVEEKQTNTGTSTIKKTGQTKSYKENGDEVTDGSILDDGHYQTGVVPRYTRASDMVTDELTNLMWQDNESVKKMWLTQTNYNTCSNDTTSSTCYDTAGDTATTYCEDLALGGYQDWRLPTSVELEGIVDYGKYDPALNSTFVNFSSNRYWSSTTLEYHKYAAWVVVFNYGFVDGDDKNDNYFVRCVRAGQ